MWVGPCFAQTSSAPDCLSYSPSVVTLEGRFLGKTFPGPPHYRSILKGDKPEKLLVLQLRKPICLNEDSTKPKWNRTQSDVKEVELVLERDQLKKYDALVGSSVVVTGELSSVSLHNFTPVYLIPHSLKRK